MVKRAALARALALDPEILFLDEPTSDLDPLTASAIDAMIGELNQSLGVTVVIVTHDLTTLFTLCDRVAVLVDHRIAVDTLDGAAAIGPTVDTRIPPRPARTRRDEGEEAQIMETDKRYFIEGLFIIGFSVAAALFAVWLTEHRQERRRHLPDSFRRIGKRPDGGRPGQVPRRRRRNGQDTGARPRQLATRAGGRTAAPRHAGEDRHQGQPQAQRASPASSTSNSTAEVRRRKSLVAATPAGQIPEIPYEKSSLANLLDQLPQGHLQKFSALEDKATKVVSDVAGVTKRNQGRPVRAVAGAQGKTRGGRRQAETGGPQP